MRGIGLRGVVSFLGIPFGASTGGAGRFQAPAEHPGWTGVLDAFCYGAAAPQPDSRLETPPTGLRADWTDLQHPRAGNSTEGLVTSEDCLSLNVWTPDTDPGARRPVLVWVHGGGFHSGSTGTEATQGAALARTGDAVVVSIGHRLGVLGCLRLDLLAPDDYPDAGLAGQLDVALGLDWIRRNIESFGGDPGCVTVFGQSGGGMKITALLGMPDARSSFHRAVNCSGPGIEVQTKEDGLRAAELLLQAAQVRRPGDLGNLPVAELIDAGLGAAALDAAQAKGGQPAGMMMFRPGLHDTRLPVQPFGPDGPSSGVPDIPMMFGYTTHEATLFLMGMPGFERLDGAGLRGALAPRYGDQVEGILARYQEYWGEEAPSLRLARILTDATFRGGQWRLATAKAEHSAPVYVYHFDYRPDILGGALGATHSMDVPFLFGTTDRAPVSGTDAYRHELSDAMLRSLAAFARTGDPATPAVPDWPAFRADRPGLMRFAGDIRSVDATAEQDVAVPSQW